MIGLLKGLFSTPKAVDTASNVVNGAVKGIDALFFTKEEKAHFSQQTMETWLKMQTVTANENSIRSITRRKLAVGFCQVFLFFLIVGGVLYLYRPDWGLHFLGLAKQLSPSTLLILGFYFGYYAVSNIVSKVKK